MMLLAFLFVVTPLVEAKCGLWYTFNHNAVTNTYYTSWSTPTANSNRQTGSNFQTGYGFESLDKAIICNDMEMFHQCNRAQYILDKFTDRNNLPIHTVGCADNIVCAAQLPPGNGIYWCQNMDSYDLCVFVQNIINAANQTNLFPVSCNVAILDTDNIMVLSYRRANPITTTTTVTTIFNPNDTTTATTTINSSPVITTVPSTGNVNKLSLLFIFFIFLL